MDEKKKLLQKLSISNAMGIVLVKTNEYSVNDPLHWFFFLFSYPNEELGLPPKRIRGKKNIVMCITILCTSSMI